MAPKKRPRLGDCTPGYSGWVPAPGERTVARVLAGALSPLQFFEQFVAARRPVVIEGGLDDSPAPGSWTDDYLRERAGDTEVRVERRRSAAVSFGGHSHERLRFAAVLDALAAGDETLYLTTEATAFDDDGRLRVVSPPLPLLLDDLQLRPRLAGRLVPVAVNMWLGRSAAGASSGLHHDWHDNFYQLMRGAKSFELFAPSETARLYPYGEVARVHANGRINYVGALSRADGADAADVARVARLDVEQAELRVAAAEAAVAASEPGAAASLRSAETLLEQALEASIAAGGGPDFEEVVEEDDDDDDDDAEPPPHFSRCGGRVQALESPEQFPLFCEAVSLTAELRAGDALYLPCGWWHEVTSWGHSHLALNWWFAPPDTSRFEAPYSDKDELWERDFAHWQRRYGQTACDRHFKSK